VGFIAPVAVWPQQAPLTAERDLPKIEGRAVNSVSGEPVRKAIVTLRPTGGEISPRTVTSDSAGNFVFDNLPAGTYRLAARRTGFLNVEYGSVSSSSDGAALSVSAGQSVTGLIIKLTPQAIITGKVMDEEGEPAPGTTVVLLRQAGFGNSRRLTKIDWATANDLGEFRIPGLSPGRYFLAADARDSDAADGPTSTEEDYAPTFYPGTTEPAGAAAVRVDAGLVVSGINIPLRKTRLFHLRGRVVAGPALGPLRSIQVALLPRRAADVMMGLAQMTTMATPEGAFEFKGVQPGAYYLAAIRTQGQPQVLGRIQVEVTGASL